MVAGRSSRLRQWSFALATWARSRQSRPRSRSTSTGRCVITGPAAPVLISAPNLCCSTKSRLAPTSGSRNAFGVYMATCTLKRTHLSEGRRIVTPCGPEPAGEAPVAACLPRSRARSSSLAAGSTVLPTRFRARFAGSCRTPARTCRIPASPGRGNRRPDRSRESRRHPIVPGYTRTAAPVRADSCAASAKRRISRASRPDRRGCSPQRRASMPWRVACTKLVSQPICIDR